MAAIKKLMIDNVAVYPRTVTDAVVDTSTGRRLSEVIPEMRSSIERVVLSVPSREIKPEEIDDSINLLNNH